MGTNSSIFESKPIKYPLALAGQIQLFNSALALAALEILQNKAGKLQKAPLFGNGKNKMAGSNAVDSVAIQQHKL
jgi:dihydrofolate synthase/folylpolyglutamate synthase